MDVCRKTDAFLFLGGQSPPFQGGFRGVTSGNFRKPRTRQVHCFNEVTSQMCRKRYIFILPSLLMCTKQVQYHKYLQEKIGKKVCTIIPIWGSCVDILSAINTSAVSVGQHVLQTGVFEA